MFTRLEGENALLEIQKLKGTERAKLLEKIIRLETNHFRSKQYALSGSAGMEMGAWHGIDESKFSTFQMKDNHLTGAKQMRTFIKWNNVLDFLLYLSDYIDRHKGNYARWNSMMPERQEAYRVKLKGIVNRTIK
jgi:hypothetical protein